MKQGSEAPQFRGPSFEALVMDGKAGGFVVLWIAAFRGIGHTVYKIGCALAGQRRTSNFYWRCSAEDIVGQVCVLFQASAFGGGKFLAVRRLDLSGGR